MIFSKLGNIFSKNKNPDQNILSEKSNRKSVGVFSARNEDRAPIHFEKKSAKTAHKVIVRSQSDMAKTIKENILYPEVNDTQEDILEDKDLEFELANSEVP